MLIVGNCNLFAVLIEKKWVSAREKTTAKDDLISLQALIDSFSIASSQALT
jgi:hypothetical protein